MVDLCSQCWLPDKISTKHITLESLEFSISPNVNRSSKDVILFIHEYQVRDVNMEKAYAHFWHSENR